MASEPSSENQRTHPSYTLLYHPGIPGRGEYIRLVFEAAGVPYIDAANESSEGKKAVYAACAQTSTGDDAGNPPPFCPPMLQVSGAGKQGKTLLLSQTPNILLYLGERLGLAGADDDDDGDSVVKYHVHGLALTALDLSNEAHDTHHPVATHQYYDVQKPEALRRATDFRENRLPKFAGYFERVLKGNAERGRGRYLVGDRLTYADLTLWQVLDGLLFAFPNEMAVRQKEYPTLFGEFYPAVKEEKGVKEYLASGRRLKFGNGLFRHYPELDRQQ